MITLPRKRIPSQENQYQGNSWIDSLHVFVGCFCSWTFYHLLDSDKIILGSNLYMSSCGATILGGFVTNVTLLSAELNSWIQSLHLFVKYFYSSGMAKKTNPKNPPKKPQSKNPTKNGVFWFFLNSPKIIQKKAKNPIKPNKTP